MSIEPVHNLETLKVWQLAVDFAVRVNKEALPLFPNEERYALTDQLRRSSQSIAANIAEGHGRYHFQEAIHSCLIARGSLEETLSHLTMAYRLGYLPEEIFAGYKSELVQLNRSLNGYIAFLKQSKQGSKEYGTSIHETEGVYTLDTEVIEEPFPNQPINESTDSKNIKLCEGI